MQRGSTILQYLTFRPNVLFDNPAHPDGRLWNSALYQVAQTQGWSSLHWGKRIDSEEVAVADLLITWKSHAELQKFMANNYRLFLSAVEPLLAFDSSSNTTPIPYIISLHPSIPCDELGAVTSIYEINFNSELDAKVKTTLGIEIQLCRSFLFREAETIGDGYSELFLGLDAVWLEQYHPMPSSTISLAAPDSAIGRKQDERTQQHTFLVIVGWANQDAEKTILESGRIGVEGGDCLSTGDYFAKNILQRSIGYMKHYVAFENVSEGYEEWLNKEEKWSTYVARLLAEEEHRKETENSKRNGLGDFVEQDHD